MYDIDVCRNLVIRTADDFKKSAEMLAFVNLQISSIEEQTQEAISKAHSLHKKLCNDRSVLLSPWKEVSKQLGNMRNIWMTKLDEERKKAEAEAIEKARIAAEKEREHCIKMADKVKMQHKKEEWLIKADNVYQQPVFVQEYVPKKVETTLGNVSSRQDFDVIVDVMSVCKAVIVGKLPVGVLSINDKAIKTAVKLGNIKTGDIEGLTIQTKFRDVVMKGNTA